MRINGKDILGRRLVAARSGEHIGNVKELVFDVTGRQLLALRIDGAGWFRGAQVVLVEHVQSVGEDAVMVDDAHAVVKARTNPEIDAALDHNLRLIGLELLSESGDELGRIVDVQIEIPSGRVVGYEASAGMLADLASGRMWLSTPEALRIGATSAVVPEAAAAAMRAAPARGGIQAALQSAKSKLGAVVDEAKDELAQSLDAAGQAVQGARSKAQQALESAKSKAEQSLETVKDKAEQTFASVKDKAGHTLESVKDQAEQTAAQADEALDSARHKAESALDSAKSRLAQMTEDLRRAGAEKQRGWLVGKATQSDVFRDDGSLLVPKGTLITAPLAEEAERAGKLMAVVASATGAALASAAVQAKAKVGGAIDQLNPGAGEGRGAELVDKAVDKAAAAAATAAEQGRELLGRAKTWLGQKSAELGDLIDEQHRPSEAQRIDAALGRPATRTVRAPDDSVLVAAGDTISHATVDAARRHGVLQALLDAVEPPGTAAS